MLVAGRAAQNRDAGQGAVGDGRGVWVEGGGRGVREGAVGNRSGELGGRGERNARGRALLVMGRR